MSVQDPADVALSVERSKGSMTLCDSTNPNVREPAQPRSPLIVQASADLPVFRGNGVGGRDIYCSDCGSVVLLENLRDGDVYDLTIECAGCAGRTDLPALPAGRGLGGVLRTVTRDHRAVGTFVLDMDEVIAGEPAVHRRAQETGSRQEGRTELVLDVPGIEEALQRARSTFARLLAIIMPQPRGPKPSRHRLVQMIDQIEENIVSLRAGGDIVEVFAVIDLNASTSAFSRWAKDPSMGTLLQEGVQPEGFDHNVSLLQVASILEEAGLGPEFVPPSGRRSPDLVLRIAAGHFIQVEVKAPRALRTSPSGSESPGDPRRVIKKAIRSSRGQFGEPGILAIIGDSWPDGIDAFVDAATAYLGSPLPTDASADATAHHELLLGVLLIESGYRVEGRAFAAQANSKWVPNPQYAGSIQLTLPPDLIGPYEISYLRHGADNLPDPSTRDASAGAGPSFTTEHGGFNAVRYRVNEGEIEVEGTMSNELSDTDHQLLAALTFPEGQRPATEEKFDVVCEVGFTVVIVQTDGELLADPTVGWIDLQGVRFKPGNSMSTSTD